MKINFTVLFLFFILFISKSFSQNSPKVPERIRIDNMVLNISEDVIPIIQNEVDALDVSFKNLSEDENPFLKLDQLQDL